MGGVPGPLPDLTGDRGEGEGRDARARAPLPPTLHAAHPRGGARCASPRRPILARATRQKQQPCFFPRPPRDPPPSSGIVRHRDLPTDLPTAHDLPAHTHPSTHAELDAVHVRLLLPTLEAVLVAFHRHPHALTQLVEDDVETAYGLFGCASCLCVSALERSDTLGLDRGTRVGLIEMLRVLVSPSTDVPSSSTQKNTAVPRRDATISAEWAEGAAARLRETPVPELPAVDLAFPALRMDEPAPSKSELSMYTRLMTQANLRAAKEA